MDLSTTPGFGDCQYRTGKGQLAKGNDDLTQWVKSNAQLFEDASDERTQVAFGYIVAKIAEQAPLMKVGALEEFLKGQTRG